MVKSTSLLDFSTLRHEVSKEFNIGEPELKRKLKPFVEAPVSRWETQFRSNPRLAVKVSALLAMGGVEGLVKPLLLDRYQNSTCFKSLRRQLLERYPESFAYLESLLHKLFALVPRPVDLSETYNVLDQVFVGCPPISVTNLLAILAPVDLLRIDGRDIDPIEAARLVREDRGTGFAEKLVEARVLPPVITSWVEMLTARQSPRAALRPVRVLAQLPAEAAALMVWGAPERLPGWETAEKCVPHIARFVHVLGLNGLPTISPTTDLLRNLRFDEQLAPDYDAALSKDASDRAADLVDSELFTESQASAKAAAQVMRGFQPFCGYLTRVAHREGAPITALPRGIAVERRNTTVWQGVREDLSQRPETTTRFLALLPELIKDEPLGHLIVLQMLSGARASVVLALKRSYIVEVPEGWLVHVPWQGNKTGRGLLFVAKPFLDYFGITREWLPEDAPVDPPQLQRDKLSKAIDQICRAFELRTGEIIPHRSSRFTRSALVQLLRPKLTGTDRETITALLNHKIRNTRHNYVRPWPEEIDEAYRKLGELNG